MKTIKIKYVGFWDGFNPENCPFTKMILDNYNVVESDNPDYIICSCFPDENYYEYCNYNQVRIMYSGENYIPDFNLIDYAVSTYPIIFQDRHFRYPICFDNYNFRFETLLKKNRNYSKRILKEKTYFANFIFSHESEKNLRGDFYKQLSKYKRIESFGSFLNNQPSCNTVDILSKSDVQRLCKFTLCFESTKHEGFITEKIVDAFFADTIPIYFGSSDVKNIFNENAFLYCEGKEDFDTIIKKIIELDTNDDMYINMLRQPIFQDWTYASTIKEELKAYVHHIFDQPLDQAFRRSQVYIPREHEKFINNASKAYKALHLGIAIPNIKNKALLSSFIRTMKKNIKNFFK